MVDGGLQIVLDTNIFLQLRDVKDLPWDKQFPKFDAIELIVGHAVVGELDEKKTSREKRLRTRARLALDLIDQASAEAGQSLQLRAGPPEIRLVLDLSNPEFSNTIRLNPSRNDDQLVALALERAKRGPCVLFSHDTGPVIRARGAGLSAFRAPDDWHLPEQPDEQGLELKRLRAEVTALKLDYPEIAADFVNREGATIDQITSRVLILPPFPQDLAQELSDVVLKASPAAHLPPIRDSGLGAFGRGSVAWGITEYEAAVYRKEYAKYRTDVQKLFSGLSSGVRQASLAVQISYRLENVSTHTALRLRIRFTGADNSVLLVRRKIRRIYGVGELGIPKPPKAPKASSLYDIPSHLALPDHSEPRDPTEFFWQHEPALDDLEGTFVCEEFRPKAVESFAYYILPQSDPEKDVYRGQASLEVSATNLPAPVNRQVNIERVQETASWADTDVLAIFPNELRPHLDGWVAAGKLI